MASKKGIIVTAIILVAISTASFSVWMIPQNNQISFVVTDFGAHLDGVKNIHIIIIEDLESEFNRLLDREISTVEFIQIAEVSSTQINSQIIQIVESKASEEWQDSYLNYLEALRKSNSYIRETIVYANMLNDNKPSEELEKTLEDIKSIKSEFGELIKASDNTRP